MTRRSDDDLIAAARADARHAGGPGAGAGRTPFVGYDDPRLALGEDAIDGYRLRGEIHRGAQGVVYEALQESTRRRVAVKVMRRRGEDDAGDRARFEREVTILGQLRHPNIVTIHDSGETSGVHWFVMDYIEGQPLDVWVAAAERSVEQVLRLAVVLCEAVAAAHVLGVTHRDLKPGNILVDPSGRPHVLDFGLAKPAAGGTTDAASMTRPGQFVGSLPWAAPEQAGRHGARVDLRTDVYALGVILHQALTGRFPYEVAGNLADVLDAIRHAEPHRPSRHRRELAGDVDTIVLTCLAKDPARRYQSAGELGRDIERTLEGEPIVARRDAGLYVLGRLLRRHRHVGFALAVLLLAGLATLVGVSLAWRSARSERDRASQAAQQAAAARDALQVEEQRLRRSLYHQSILLAHGALDDDHGARAQALLAEAPVELRGWEWSHLSGRADTSELAIEAHDDTLLAVAASADGQRLASAAADGSLALWHARSGYRVAHAPDAHDGAVNALAFSSDCRRLYSAGVDGRVLLHDGRDGSGPLRVHDGDEALHALAVHPGAPLLAVGSPHGVRLVDEETGAHRLLDLGPPVAVHALAFTPDGDRLLIGGADGVLRVWHLEQDRSVLRIAAHEGRISAVACDRTAGRLLTGGVDGTARLFDADGAPLHTLPGNGSWVFAVDVHPLGDRLLTAGADHSVKLWSADDGALIERLHGHTDRVYAARFTPDGEWLLSGGRDGTLRTWSARREGAVTTVDAHRGQVWCARFAPDGAHLASVGSDGQLRLFDAADPGLVPAAASTGHGTTVSVAYSPDGLRLATAGDDGRPALWDAAGPDKLRVLDAGPDGRVHDLVFLPDGQRLVGAADDHTLRLWDTRDGRLLRTVPEHPGRALCLDVSADGRFLVSGGSGGAVQRTDLAGDGAVTVWRPHTSAIWDLALSPDGRWLVTASQDQTLAVLDATSGATLHLLTGHRDGVRCVAVAGDGRRIASGGWDRTIRLWDVDSGEAVLVLPGGGRRVESLHFSPDGRRLLSADLDGRLRLFDGR